MIGYEDHEVANNFSAWEQLVHPKDHDRMLLTVQKYFEGKSAVFELEYRLRHKDGSYRWILARGKSLRNAEGKVYWMAGSHTDITDRKQAEEALAEEKEKAIKSGDNTRKALVSMLEDINHQKAELQKAYDRLKESTAQIVQSEKLAALGELAAGVAHELNQPLNCIKVISQSTLRDIEKKRFEPAEFNSDLVEIVRQIDKMAEIITHMRIFTRKQVGIVKQETDINSVIEGAFKLIGQQLKVHNIDVVMELSHDLPKIKSDAVKLEEVILNLITNARDAVEKYRSAEGRIKIKSFNKKEKTDRVVFSVWDNGGGIPREIQKKIFDPFFTTKEPGKGTGLGLSISKKIVEELGGQIELEVVDGESCQFSVSMPIE